MRLPLHIALLATASQIVPAQELLWRREGVAGQLRHGIWLDRLDDVDGDGIEEILELGEAAGTSSVLITSGRFGSVLASHQFAPNTAQNFVARLGDMNGDGFCDYGTTVTSLLPTPLPKEFQIRSGRDHSLIRTVFGPPWGTWGLYWCGDLDVNGDGNRDLVLSDVRASPGGEVHVYDHSGALLYSIVNTNLSMVIGVWLAPLGGDFDGDGGEDFLVAAPEVGERGAILLISGRTGATLRTSFGELRGDKLSCCAGCGDLDGDGVLDYAGGGFWGVPVVRTFSGATGNPIYTYRVNAACGLGTPLIASHDLDQDGVRDMFVGCSPTDVYALSGRTGTVLWSYSGYNGHCAGSGLTVLDPPPGEQYPLIVYSEHCWSSLTNGQPGGLPGLLWARRFRPESVRAYGQSSSLTWNEPVRMGMSDPVGPFVRFTVSGAPPGVLAVLALGFSDTRFHGVPLPASLAPLGFPGIHLEASPEVLVPTMTGTSPADHGFAALELPATLSVSWAANAVPVFAQWHWLDVGSTTLHGSTVGHRMSLR